MAITEAVTQGTQEAGRTVVAQRAATANGSTGTGLPDPKPGQRSDPKSNPKSRQASGEACGQASDQASGQAECFRPVPVWFFTFEGMIGASYDIIRTATYGWVFLVLAVAVNVVLARTVLRGRLRMAKAMLRGRKTRKIAVGLIALRVGVHYAFRAIGVAVAAPAAHFGFAVLMCATTVTLLAVEQRVMLRALSNC